jgi:hypothetical protein
MKTKQRNKLLTGTISGLLYTKEYLGQQNCFDFTIKKEMLQNMNKANLYEFKTDTQED